MLDGSPALVEELERMGLRRPQLQELARRASPAPLPEELEAAIRRHHWPEEQVAFLHDVVLQMIREQRLDAGNASQVTSILAARAFGQMTPDESTVVTLFENLDDEETPNLYGISLDDIEGSHDSWKRCLEEMARRYDGTLPLFNRLTTQEQELVRVVSRGVRDWRALGAEWLQGESRRNFLSWPWLGASFPERLLRHLDSLGPREQTWGMLGQARVTTAVGFATMSQTHDAYVELYGPEATLRHRWRRFVGTPRDYVRLAATLNWKPKRDRFRGVAGWVAFADRYFGGDLVAAWESVSAIVGARFDEDLAWGPRPTGLEARHARIEAALGGAERTGVEGQIDVALRTMMPGLYAVWRNMRLLGERRPGFRYIDGTVGEWAQLPSWLRNGRGRLKRVFFGNDGLQLFADTYFRGQVRRALALVRQREGAATTRALGWPRQAPLSREQLPEQGALAAPFPGSWIPAPVRQMSEEEIEGYSREQRRVIVGYLTKVVDLWLRGEDRYVGLHEDLRVADRFESRSAAFIAIRRFAMHFGIPFRSVLVEMRGEPTEELRAIWREEAVDLYLEWMLQHQLRNPIQRDFGSEARRAQIGIAQRRLYGSDAYGVGGSNYSHRIFDNQQDAVVAIARRARELSIPFSTLNQHYQAGVPTPELRAEWQLEARALLERWRDAHPGVFPIAPHWGQAPGRTGIPYTSFFRLGPPNRWIFASLEEANQAMIELFGRAPDRPFWPRRRR